MGVRFQTTQGRSADAGGAQRGDRRRSGRGWNPHPMGGSVPL